MGRRFSMPQRSNGCANCMSCCRRVRRHQAATPLGSERAGTPTRTARPLWMIRDLSEDLAPLQARATQAGAEAEANYERCVSGRERRVGPERMRSDPLGSP